MFKAVQNCAFFTLSWVTSLTKLACQSSSSPSSSSPAPSAAALLAPGAVPLAALNTPASDLPPGPHCWATILGLAGSLRLGLPASQTASGGSLGAGATGAASLLSQVKSCRTSASQAMAATSISASSFEAGAFPHSPATRNFMTLWSSTALSSTQRTAPSPPRAAQNPTYSSCRRCKIWLARTPTGL